MFSRTISAPNQRNPDSCEDFDFSRQEVEQRTSNAQAYFDLFSSIFFARILNIFSTKLTVEWNEILHSWKILLVHCFLPLLARYCAICIETDFYHFFYILKASLAAYLSDPPIVTGT
jgi:hypothetical protein